MVPIGNNFKMLKAAKKETNSENLYFSVRQVGARRWPLPIGNNFKVLKVAKEEEDQQILRKAGARRWSLPIGNNFKMLKVAKEEEYQPILRKAGARKQLKGVESWQKKKKPPILRMRALLRKANRDF